MRFTIIYLSFCLLSNLNLQAQCFEPDASIWLDTWATCETSPNPKSNYGNTHWIQYDFGEVRNLSKTWVWNTNDPGKLNQGFNQVKIDLSVDGEEWIYWGEMNFPIAQGETIYGGFPGPDLQNMEARFVLFTALTNHGHASCYGLSEVKFNLFPEIIMDSTMNEVECFEIEEIVLEELTPTEAYLYWETEFEGDEAYFIFQFQAEGGEVVEIETDEPEIFLEFLEPNTNYEYRVVIECEDELVYSDYGNFTTPGIDEDCFNVEDIWLVETNNTEATIEWEGIEDIDFYLVRYGLVEEYELEEELEREETIVFLEGLTPFSEYQMRVGVECEEYIIWSDPFFFTTGSTSTDEIGLLKNRMKIFPNPTQDEFILEYQSRRTENLNFTITDIHGKVIQSQTMSLSEGSNKRVINLGNLPNGIYLINTQTQISGTLISEKIIKI